MAEDSNDTAHPFLSECPFCQQGMLRFWFIGGSISALCDECDLYWRDPQAIASDPTIPASGTLDPDSGELDHRAAMKADVEQAGLDDLIAGYSV